eukprot:m.68891 g.68891  ORF g.68891 m.68891 type:complete len:304 (+) comp13936_c0_seq3:143-1054(+)
MTSRAMMSLLLALVVGLGSTHTHATAVGSVSSSGRVGAPPGKRWVSSWCGCSAEKLADVHMYFGNPNNTGSVSSLLLYTGVIKISPNGTLAVGNVSSWLNCAAQVGQYGVKAEAMLGYDHEGFRKLSQNATLLAQFAADLGQQAKTLNLFGVTTDWENMEGKSHADLVHLFSVVKPALNANGARLAPYIDHGSVYDHWEAFLGVTDKVLDGACYWTESPFDWYKACRPFHLNTTAQKAHAAPALLASAKPGPKGHWGFDKKGAEEKLAQITHHGLSEIGMFALKDIAKFWPPLLKEWLKGPAP